MSPSIKGPRTRAGFTLVEMMTAIGVFTLIIVMLGQVLTTVNQAWVDGQRRVNNFTKARAMLDMFAHDIQAGVFRSDLAAFPGTDIAFYTKRPGALAPGRDSYRELLVVPEQRQQQDDRQRNSDQPQQRAFPECHFILRHCRPGSAS